MGEVVNVLVAFAVIVFLFRWATSSSDSPEQRNVTNTLGFRPKNVTQDMVNTISNMFPDIPADNIRYDLLRTGSVEQTTNKILERGFLDAPPQAYHTLYPRNITTLGSNPTPNANNANSRTGTNSTAGTGTGGASGSRSIPIPKKPTTTLISRYHLEHLTQLQSQSQSQTQAQSTAGAEASMDNKVDSDSNGNNNKANDDPFQAGGKAVWEDTPEKREESLRRRKAQMVLAARQRLLSQQQEREKEAAGSTSISQSS